MSEKHVLVFFRFGDGGTFPECSCGWMGDASTSEADARDLWQDHLSDMASFECKTWDAGDR